MAGFLLQRPTLLTLAMFPVLVWMYSRLGDPQRARSGTRVRRALDARAKWLLEYPADHEAILEQTVANVERQADPKALHTWVYDYLSHAPIAPHYVCLSPYAGMSFDDICRKIFSLHDQVIELYRYLEGLVEISETRELLKLEEHEAMRLAQQTNRARDL